MLLLALFSLSACGPSSADKERRAAQEERAKLHEERKEDQKDRERNARVEGECAASYNTCVARCDELLSPSTRAACVTDCANVRSDCLMAK